VDTPGPPLASSKPKPGHRRDHEPATEPFFDDAISDSECQLRSGHPDLSITCAYNTTRRMNNDASATIETAARLLRPFEEADAGIGFAWFFDPEVMRFIPSGPDQTLDDSRRRISGYLAHQAKHGFSKRLILHRESGQPMGDAGLFYLPDGRRIELGFRRARPDWGQGYAMEVARGWFAWFDKHLPGQPLFADVHPEHTRFPTSVGETRVPTDGRIDHRERHDDANLPACGAMNWGIRRRVSRARQNHSKRS